LVKDCSPRGEWVEKSWINSTGLHQFWKQSFLGVEEVNHVSVNFDCFLPHDDLILFLCLPPEVCCCCSVGCSGFWYQLCSSSRLTEIQLSPLITTPNTQPILHANTVLSTGVYWPFNLPISLTG
jgi:hypothetical protein